MSEKTEAGLSPEPGLATLPSTDDDIDSRPVLTHAPAVPGYEILGVLGRGGMGVVFKARQIAADRVVALKMILGGGAAGKAELARFKTEAEAVARLQHPGIVQVFEVGEYEGLPYFSLEYCPGGSLEKKLGGKPVAAAEAAALVETLAEAAHAAHLANVIHRDLKPANVLLTGEGKPKITDFGLAKKMDQAGQTRTGAVMGTPAYMSPEQARGEPHGVGPHTDVWALGAVLYQCLTGRPPFLAATPVETVMQVLHREPAPVRQLQPNVPVDLETICLKCLRKEPRLRYGTAAELADDLRRFRTGEPIAARPVGLVERGWRWCRRNPAVAALLAVTAAAALVVLGVILVVNVRLQHERDIAAGERDAADAARAYAEQREAAARRHLYTSRISWAQQARENGQLERVRELLLLTAREAKDGGEDLRGFEWHCLWQDCQRQAFSLRGHAGPVSSVAAAPDGQTLASGSFDGTVRLWELPSGRERAVLRGHTDGVTCIAFSRDGKLIASGSSDQTARLWDPATGSERAVLKDHGGRVAGVAISPDGEVVATCAADGVVKLWNGKGAELATLPGHRGGAHCVTFSPDGTLLASGGADRTLRLWDVAMRQERAALPGHGDAVNCLAFSPDGKTVATGGQWDKSIRLWDVAGKKSRVVIGGHQRPGHLSRVLCLAFSPDGKTLATGGGDLTARLWDATTGQFRGDLPPHAGVIFGVAFLPDGKTIATAAGDETVKLWDVATRQAMTPRPRAARRPPMKAPGYLWNVRFSPDGRVVAAGVGAGGIPGRDGGVRLWDFRTGKGGELLANPTGGTCRSVAFSPDGKEVAAGSQDGTARVWDAATGNLRLTLKGSKGTVSSVAWSPDGSALAVASTDGFVTLFDAATGKVNAVLKGHDQGFLFVTFSPDGRRIATASYDHTVKLWDARTSREEATLRGHTGWVTSAAFSPDGQTLVTTGGVYDHTARLWDVATGRERAVLKGHSDAVNCAAFTPDGRTLATGGEDSTVRLWDPIDGLEWITLREHAGPVMSVAFSLDGKALAACGGLVGEVKVWEASGEVAEP